MSDLKPFAKHAGPMSKAGFDLVPDPSVGMVFLHKRGNIQVRFQPSNANPAPRQRPWTAFNVPAVQPLKTGITGGQPRRFNTPLAAALAAIEAWAAFT